jgi:tRNA A58 N-methylase Trm61
MKRGPTPIYPKDASAIGISQGKIGETHFSVGLLDLNDGCKVLEAGTGSGKKNQIKTL